MLSKTIFLISEIVLMSIVVLSFYFATSIHVPRQLKIEKGNIRSIIANLGRKEHIGFTFLDLYALRVMGLPQAGWIDLGKEQLTRADFLYRLTKAKAALFDVTIVPGETTYLFLKNVSKSYNYPFKEMLEYYKNIAPYPEGVFYAQTYALPKGIDYKKFIEILLQKSLHNHRNLAAKLQGRFNQKLWFERVITIASIIQKEAATKDEMPLIASVIYNRLKKGMPLQMDGTLNYGKYSHQKITPQRIREDRSAFNTYKFKGLPPYPVCIVSKDAIIAAIKPAKTNYLYFVRGASGKHIFSSSYKNHLKNIKNVQK